MTPDTRRAIRASLLLLASALAACGGGSSAVTSSATVRFPSDATLGFALTPTAIKTFHFSWNDAAAETGYRLLEDPDGASGYTPIADLPAHTTQYDHEVFLPERVNARYRLQVCHDQDCVDTAALRVSDTLVPAIGYVKAAAPADNDHFGQSVAVSADGQFLAVGAPGSASGRGSGGAVYVFARTGAQWAQASRLTPPAPEPGDLFGHSLALSSDGGTLAVGAPNGSSGGVGHSGTAFVFTRGSGAAAWGLAVRVAAPNADAGDRFGWRVALSDDGATLAVGAPDESGDARTVNGADNNSRRRSGAAYVFALAAGAWTQQAYVKASNADADDGFGAALALSADGQTLAIGAINESSAATGVGGDPDDNTAQSSGAVYVFGRARDSWSQLAYVKASNTLGNAAFGGAIALSADGQVMAVGSPYEASGARGIDGDPHNNAATGSGAVYLFDRPGGQWRQSAYVKASNADADDNFGTSVALSGDGDTLAVGAPGEGSAARGLQADQGDNSAPWSGAAYLLRRTASGWRQQTYIKPSNTLRGDGFGSTLALSGQGGVGTPSVALAAGSPSAVNASPGIGGDQADRSGSDVGAVYLY
ncbi:FG-GAP repeat protein [Hydrogenophaga sp. YM1]|uniref:FG-GAP repeat protein n=1 Tax=Hydrogenophaga sp. YM1 TaxID=2806262 RepID=UPI00195A1218|nr:FG-GAP repeat protein [Hydrogenophaga sp. YM1]QRR33362.1 FG-GAP repeat protein [Hydrogenophaga sp. YM1]